MRWLLSPRAAIPIRLLTLALIALTVALGYVTPRSNALPLLQIPLAIFALASPITWSMLLAVVVTVLVMLEQHAIGYVNTRPDVVADFVFRLGGYAGLCALVAYVSLLLHRSELRSVEAILVRDFGASLDSDQTARAVVGAVVPALGDGARLDFGTDEAEPKHQTSAGITAVREETDAALTMLIPLATGGMTLGTLTLVRRHRRFDKDERALGARIGREAAIALANAALYEREREVSQAFQRAILPAALPVVSRMALNASYLPGTRNLEIGGDWYDVFPVAEGSLVLCIGDVVGHGVRAATTMAKLQQATRVLMHEGFGPAAVLARLDTMLSLQRDGYATVILGVLCLKTFELVYACAGHPAPLIWSAARLQELPTDGMMLGVAEVSRPELSVVLEPGETLVLYTDGLVEYDRDLSTGPRRLRAVLEEHASQIRELCGDDFIREVLNGQANRDDVTVLLAHRYAQ